MPGSCARVRRRTGAETAHGIRWRRRGPRRGCRCGRPCGSSRTRLSRSGEGRRLGTCRAAYIVQVVGQHALGRQAEVTDDLQLTLDKAILRVRESRRGERVELVARTAADDVELARGAGSEIRVGRAE